jgi:hypothetical protein
MDVSKVPSDAQAVTPDDIAPNHGVGFMVAVAGNVAITTDKGSVTTIPACQAGVQYWFRFRRIMSTNTTATGIIRFPG